MDNKNKQRLSTYIDKKLVDKMDIAVKLSDCNSRNEFVVRALKNILHRLCLTASKRNLHRLLRQR